MRGDYLAKLSQAARWYLPQAEAAEVVEDYRDLIQQEPRSEEELLRDLGSPWSAARQLAQPGAYRRCSPCWRCVCCLRRRCRC